MIARCPEGTPGSCVEWEAYMTEVRWGSAASSRGRAVGGRGGIHPAKARAALASASLALAALAGACSSQSETPPEARIQTPRADPMLGTVPSPRTVTESAAVPKGGGIYKIGNPYLVAGQLFVPHEDPGYDRTGVASWYGTDFHGRKTANGEVFDMGALTAAHQTLPLPSYAYVTNLENGRTILVRINDRGPYARERILDLSRASAQALGYQTAGTAGVRVRYAGPAPLEGNDGRERQYLASQSWYRSGLATAEVNRPRVPYATDRGSEPQPWNIDAYRRGKLASGSTGAQSGLTTQGR